VSKQYLIDWVIRGTMMIVADSQEEAEAKMGRFSIYELAETGELEVYDAQTAEDVAKETVSFRAVCGSARNG
jgi:hypothetical protein